MDSNNMAKGINNERQPRKFIANISAGASAATTYYFKPSFPCQLIGAVLRTVTNSAAAENIAVTKMTCVDPDLLPDNIQISTGVTVTDVASSAIMKATTTASGTSNTTTVHFVPDANNLAERDLDPSSNEGLKIAIDQASSTAITGYLELEFLPL